MVVSAAAVFIFGLIWGSFFNVLILRLPADEKIGMSRSRCPKCRTEIPWYHNIPVISFFVLRGKCANCQLTISWRYPAIEFATALLFLGTYLHFGPTPLFLKSVVLYSYLWVISVIDLDHRIIPDELSLSGIVVGVAFSFFITPPSWVSSIFGILLGGGLFYAIAWGYEKFSGREGLGGGDIKLLAMLGAWLGVESVPTIILYSSVLGSIVGLSLMAATKKDMRTEIPFGPFLAAAAVIESLWGAQITGALLFLP